MQHGVLPALDLVIAMPVSWLPLVLIFSRHGRDGRGAFWGTWLGYAVANTWCYALACWWPSPRRAPIWLRPLHAAQGGLLRSA